MVCSVGSRSVGSRGACSDHSNTKVAVANCHEVLLVKIDAIIQNCIF